MSNRQRGPELFLTFENLITECEDEDGNHDHEMLMLTLLLIAEEMLDPRNSRGYSPRVRDRAYRVVKEYLDGYLRPPQLERL